ncbi:MAG: tetratricopeptide repeat protein [Steroidobacteraceae bacterium]
MVRVLGLLIGLLFIAFPFMDGKQPEAWLAPFVGAAFIAYGLGGQRWLRKIVPSWAEQSDELSTDNANASDSPYQSIEQKHLVGTRSRRALLGAVAVFLLVAISSWPQLLRLAAAGGFPAAAYRLGLAYQEGNGFPRDRKQALAWFNRAADAGNAEAQNALGDLYRFADPPEKDYTLALHWYAEAAKRGNAEGQYSLGTLYQGGLGAPRDYDAAIQWYLKAANQGQLQAQLQLAHLYESGRGSEVDVRRAIEWYSKAAAQGDPEAVSALARLRP